MNTFYYMSQLTDINKNVRIDDQTIQQTHANNCTPNK